MRPTQLALAHPAGECRVGDREVVVLVEEFVHAHHITADALEQLGDQGQAFGVNRRGENEIIIVL